MARADFVVQLHLDLDTYNDLDTASTFRGHWPWKVLSAASGHGKSLSLRYLKTKSWGTYSSVSIQVHLYPQLKRDICFFERVSLLWLGFKPETFYIEGEHLIHYSIKEEIKK